MTKLYNLHQALKEMSSNPQDNTYRYCVKQDKSGRQYIERRSTVETLWRTWKGKSVNNAKLSAQDSYARDKVVISNYKVAKLLSQWAAALPAGDNLTGFADPKAPYLLSDPRVSSEALNPYAPARPEQHFFSGTTRSNNTIANFEFMARAIRKDRAPTLETVKAANLVQEQEGVNWQVAVAAARGSATSLASVLAAAGGNGSNYWLGNTSWGELARIESAWAIEEPAPGVEHVYETIETEDGFLVFDQPKPKHAPLPQTPLEPTPAPEASITASSLAGVYETPAKPDRQFGPLALLQSIDGIHKGLWANRDLKKSEREEIWQASYPPRILAFGDNIIAAGELDESTAGLKAHLDRLVALKNEYHVAINNEQTLMAPSKDEKQYQAKRREIEVLQNFSAFLQIQIEKTSALHFQQAWAPETIPELVEDPIDNLQTNAEVRTALKNLYSDGQKLRGQALIDNILAAVEFIAMDHPTPTDEFALSTEQQVVDKFAKLLTEALAKPGHDIGQTLYHDVQEVGLSQIFAALQRFKELRTDLNLAIEAVVRKDKPLKTIDGNALGSYKEVLPPLVLSGREPQYVASGIQEDGSFLDAGLYQSGKINAYRPQDNRDYLPYTQETHPVHLAILVTGLVKTISYAHEKVRAELWTRLGDIYDPTGIPEGDLRRFFTAVAMRKADGNSLVPRSIAATYVPPISLENKSLDERATLRSVRKELSTDPNVGLSSLVFVDSARVTTNLRERAVAANDALLQRVSDARAKPGQSAFDTTLASVQATLAEKRTAVTQAQLQKMRYEEALINDQIANPQSPSAVSEHLNVAFKAAYATAEYDFFKWREADLLATMNGTQES